MIKGMGYGKRVFLCYVLWGILVWGYGFEVSSQENVFRPQIHEEEVLAVEWLSSGEVVLDNGERILLAGVYVPRKSWFQTEEGRHLYARIYPIIRDKLLSKVVRVYSYDTVPDRYRVRYGDVYTGYYGEWFQSWLVSEGWAWVLPSPWSYERNKVLLEAESDARRAGRGFWGLGVFGVEEAELWERGREDYGIVRGVVERVEYVGNNYWEMVWEGAPDLRVRFTLARYMRAPRSGDVAEVRGGVIWREGQGLMDLRSHYQLLDGEGMLWFDRYGSGDPS